MTQFARNASVITSASSLHTGICTDKDDAMSTVSDPHLVSEHPYHYLLTARSDAVLSLLVHSGRSFDEDRS